ncbi:hypothetical protein G6F65_017296 [Rhizopus arrhizus]|nr:hypothetical protein G6F65_017296 [Rhizopus arrhizus]
MTTATLHDTPLAVDRPAPGLLGLAERGLVPDALLRLGIRRLCAARLAEEYAGGIDAWTARDQQLIASLRASAVAIHTDAANAQHYELPTAFFQLCLGARMKYSSCYYPTGAETLDAAEAAMLSLYAERAELADGQDILELGCGWGSLTLWMAEHFPNARITAVSNSATQRQHIEARCRERGWRHVQVITCDVNVLSLPAGAAHRPMAASRRQTVRAHLRPPRTGLSVRNRRRRQLDGPPFLHGRHHAGGRYAAALPARSAAGSEMVSQRHALRAHGQPLAGQPGRTPRAGQVRADPGLRTARRPVEPALAHVLDGLRGTLRL